MKKLILLLFAPILLISLLTQYSETEATTKQTLSVPFIPQAPREEWTAPWNNACEEASIAMIDLYYDQQEYTTVHPATALPAFAPQHIDVQEKIITDVINTRASLYGNTTDETPEMIGTVVQEFYDWHAYAVFDPTKEDIISELEQKQPVIIPLHGQVMNQGQFSPPGPDYHVAVLIGYDAEQDAFIAHDPGSVYHGEEIVYDANQLLGESMQALIDQGYIDASQVVFTSLPPVPSILPEQHMLSNQEEHHVAIQPFEQIVQTIEEWIHTLTYRLF
jgi:hypothetical protein